MIRHILSAMEGCVYLIGGGPGDPGLLTLRGAELLGRADVVLYDGLSNTDLLRHATHAEQICVGKHGQTRIWQQQEIIAEMLRHARAGRTVARLKGGDPAVFARTAEEAESLRAAGIRFEIVPGITAALAAGSYAGIPITHRRHASAVALVTGHEEPEKADSALDWDALARFPGTLVIYMGVTTAHTWTRALIDGGKAPSTPAAILRQLSLSDQRVIRCRLDEVAEALTPATKLRPPVIVIVGEVAAMAHSFSWFETRPMFGTTILLTRERRRNDRFIDRIHDLGASVIQAPVIEIGPPQSYAELDQAIEEIPKTDYLAFTSRNGVDSFLSRYLELRGDLRGLAGVRLAVVGVGTADALRPYHLRADIVPEEFSARGLADCLGPDVMGKRVTWFRASRGPDTLKELLTQRGAHVNAVVAYEHRDVATLSERVRQQMAAGSIDWCTVTSDAIARSLVRLFGDSLRRCQLASISPAVSATLTQLGFPPTVQASRATVPDLIDAIEATVRDSFEPS